MEDNYYALVFQTDTGLFVTRNFKATKDPTEAISFVCAHNVAVFRMHEMYQFCSKKWKMKLLCKKPDGTVEVLSLG